MSHTATEESKFSTHTRHESLGTAVQFAKDRLEKMAKTSGYEYLVIGTWAMTVRLGESIGGAYLVEVEAVYARIVLADQPDDEDGAEEGPEADAPEEDEYAEHDRRKAAELGMSVESYQRGVEDR